MKKQVEVKKKIFEKKLLIGLSFALLISSFVFAGYLFSDEQSADIIIGGNNETLEIISLLTENLVVLSSNTTEDIIVEDSITYLVISNKTTTFTPIITKTLLDGNSCVDWENDCSVKFYLKSFDKGIWSEFGVSPHFTNPFILSGKAGWNPEIDGENEIKYVLQCVYNSCLQKNQINFSLQYE